MKRVPKEKPGAALIACLLACASAMLASACLSFGGNDVNRDPRAWRPTSSGAVDPRAAGAASSPDSRDAGGQPALPPSSAREPRKLQQGDYLRITLRSGVNPSGEHVEAMIDDSGNIRLPLLGAFKVEGKTTSSAARAIEKEYSNRDIYRDMVVSIVNLTRDADVQDYVSVSGCVTRRGQVLLRENMTLMEAIIAAGDANDFASDRVIIYRNGVKIRYSMKAIKKGSQPDPKLMPGDIIEVMDRWL